MLVYFENSASKSLKDVLLEASDIFAESSPESADVILFENDELPYLRASPLLRRFRAKCVCVNESDIPTFALPGLYAANIDSFLTERRTETISYFISEHARGNEAVRRLRGVPVEKRYLYSFLGGSNSWARKRLFRLMKSHGDVIIEPTHGYNHWASEPDAEAKAKQQSRYAEILAQSKFALCPRGCGLSSYRLFESMSLGVAPVVIADGWRPIDGIDWSFALFVPEAKLGRLDSIIRAHQDEWAERGVAAREAYERLLAPDRIAATLHERLAGVLAAYDPGREAALAPVIAARVILRQAYWGAFRQGLKPLLLKLLSLTRLPSPVLLRHSVEDQLAEHRANR